MGTEKPKIPDQYKQENIDDEYKGVEIEESEIKHGEEIDEKWKETEDSRIKALRENGIKNLKIKIKDVGGIARKSFDFFEEIATEIGKSRIEEILNNDSLKLKEKAEKIDFLCYNFWDGMVEGAMGGGRTWPKKEEFHDFSKVSLDNLKSKIDGYLVRRITDGEANLGNAFETLSILRNEEIGETINKYLIYISKSRKLNPEEWDKIMKELGNGYVWDEESNQYIGLKE